MIEKLNKRIDKLEKEIQVVNRYLSKLKEKEIQEKYKSEKQNQYK
jgi:prefoldin subunit 5